MLWRPMRVGDLRAVERVAAAVHPGFPEDGAVFAERLRLYPAGCRVLAVGGTLEGYVIAHPWVFGGAPGLNTLVERLPEGADTLHLHDLAVTEGARGGGFGARVVEVLAAQAAAAGLWRMTLVAVGGSDEFWRGRGFVGVEAAGTKLGSYGPAILMMRDLG